MCKPCFKDYLLNKIQTGEVLEIKCPYIDCKTIIEENLILKTIPQNLKEKYLKFKKIKILSQDSLLRWCPRPDCEHFVRAEN